MMGNCENSSSVAMVKYNGRNEEAKDCRPRSGWLRLFHVPLLVMGGKDKCQSCDQSLVVAVLKTRVKQTSPMGNETCERLGSLVVVQYERE